MGVRKNFNRREKWTFCLFFSGCWWCNAIGRSKNALSFLHHKENALRYDNSHKNSASLAQQCFYFTHASFHIVWHYVAYCYQQSLSCCITCQRCLCLTVTCAKKPTTITWSEHLKICCHVIVMQWRLTAEQSTRRFRNLPLQEKEQT